MNKMQCLLLLAELMFLLCYKSHLQYHKRSWTISKLWASLSLAQHEQFIHDLRMLQTITKNAKKIALLFIDGESIHNLSRSFEVFKTLHLHFCGKVDVMGTFTCPPIHA